MASQHGISIFLLVLWVNILLQQNQEFHVLGSPGGMEDGDQTVERVNASSLWNLSVDLQQCWVLNYWYSVRHCKPNSFTLFDKHIGYIFKWSCPIHQNMAIAAADKGFLSSRFGWAAQFSSLPASGETQPRVFDRYYAKCWQGSHLVYLKVSCAWTIADSTVLGASISIWSPWKC